MNPQQLQHVLQHAAKQLASGDEDAFITAVTSIRDAVEAAEHEEHKSEHLALMLMETFGAGLDQTMQELLSACFLDIAPRLMALAASATDNANSSSAGSLCAACVAAVFRSAASCCRPQEVLLGIMEAVDLHGGSSYPTPMFPLLQQLLALVPQLLQRVNRRRAARALEALGPVAAFAQAVGIHVGQMAAAATLAAAAQSAAQQQQQQQLQHQWQPSPPPPLQQGADEDQGAGEVAEHLARAMEPFVLFAEELWQQVLAPELSGSDLTASQQRAARCKLRCFSLHLLGAVTLHADAAGLLLEPPILRAYQRLLQLLAQAQPVAVTAAAVSSSASSSAGSSSASVTWEDLLQAAQAVDAGDDELERFELAGVGAAHAALLPLLLQRQRHQHPSALVAQAVASGAGAAVAATATEPATVTPAAWSKAPVVVPMGKNHVLLAACQLAQQLQAAARWQESLACARNAIALLQAAARAAAALPPPQQQQQQDYPPSGPDAATGACASRNDHGGSEGSNSEDGISNGGSTSSSGDDGDGEGDEMESATSAAAAAAAAAISALLPPGVTAAIDAARQRCCGGSGTDDAAAGAASSASVAAGSAPLQLLLEERKLREAAAAALRPVCVTLVHSPSDALRAAPYSCLQLLLGALPQTVRLLLLHDLCGEPSHELRVLLLQLLRQQLARLPAPAAALPAPAVASAPAAAAISAPAVTPSNDPATAPTAAAAEAADAAWCCQLYAATVAVEQLCVALCSEGAAPGVHNGSAPRSSSGYAQGRGCGATGCEDTGAGASGSGEHVCSNITRTLLHGQAACIDAASAALSIMRFLLLRLGAAGQPPPGNAQEEERKEQQPQQQQGHAQEQQQQQQQQQAVASSVSGGDCRSALASLLSLVSTALLGRLQACVDHALPRLAEALQQHSLLAGVGEADADAAREQYMAVQRLHDVLQRVTELQPCS